MSGSRDDLQTPSSAQSPNVGLVLDAAPIAPWQEACLHVLQQELGATLRRVIVAGVASPQSAQEPSRSQASAPLWPMDRPRASADQDLDLVVLLTETPPMPQALPPSKWGAWCILYGLHAGLHWRAADVVSDLLAYRRTAEVHIVRLDASARPAEFLYSATTQVWPWSPLRSTTHLQTLASRCLRAAVLRQCGQPARLVGQPVAAPVRHMRARPRRLQNLLLAFLSKAYLVHAYGWRLVFVREQWCIGVVETPLADLVQGTQPMRVHWLPNPDRFTFLADPISGDVEGQPFLLAERFNWWKSKGTIVFSRLDSNGLPETWRPLLESKAHLSYPFLLSTEDETWLCPEAWENGKIERCKIFRSENRLGVGASETMLADWPGVDPTIFRHRDSWWMFCGHRSQAPNEELHLWFADRPEGPWSPHPWNPVVIDIRHARPAGPVTMVDHGLIRPAQDCSKTYGGGLAFMRIDRLTRTAYHETLVRRIMPDDDSPWPHGLHTIGPLGGRTVVDGKRSLVSPLNPLIRLRASIKNRRRRAAIRAAGSPLHDGIINPRGLQS